MSRKKANIFEPSDIAILEVLYQYNPWWQKKAIATEKIHRSDFFKVKDRLNDQMILAIIGPRRVGKTILLYQLIEDLLFYTKDTNVLFISVDHPAIQLTGSLRKIFKIYEENILKSSFADSNERVYILLDEIQAFNNWDSELKSYYDLNYRIKFVVTGSSSVNILEGASEALVGRLHSQIVLPLKFRDYLKFRVHEFPDISDVLRSSCKNMRNALQESLLKNHSELFYEQVRNELNNLIPFKNRILGELNTYFLYGGYPQLALTTDQKKAREYLEDYVSLSILKDIRKLSRLQKTNVLYNLFYLVCKSTPHIISKQQLSNTLGIDKNTLNRYLDALRSTFLISDGYFYSGSPYSSFRNETKIYTIDIGIRNLYANSLDEQIYAKAKEVGEIVEVVVATHTNRLLFNLEGLKNKKIYYWKEGGQGLEVDIVITPFSFILPIEVKYQESVGNSDLSGIIRFSKRFHPKIALIITKDELDMHKSIIKIPAWLYLIMC